jgi:Tol biopolymer transport system component
MLTPGSKLGPYEVLEQIGAGGMGEVYRARDSRLEREVAIKVLPSSLSSDSDRVRRFEQEARAVGALNHPNVLAIYDVGTWEGSPYLVSEFLEGETLRKRLDSGVLPSRKGLDYAQQVAQGLAAAHEKGIVHRDLKPENIFITRDGRVKVLDFGLAKLIRPESMSAAQTLAGYSESATAPGQVLGTVGYMSPEQVRGVATDHRSDIFSFGAILYEMFSGERAFKRDSAVETMSAILKEEPPELAETGKQVPPGLDRIVRHCLEKNPEERFQSARDISFDLGSLSNLSATSAQKAIAAKERKKWLVPAAAAAAIIVAAVVGWWAGHGQSAGEPPTYQRLTYKHGSICCGKFAPDGLTVVYRAAWDGGPSHLYSLRTDAPGENDLGLDGVILDISKNGEMALLLHDEIVAAYIRRGTLARMPVAGGAPREIVNDVQDASWGPDGENLCIVRSSPSNNTMTLEYPIGKVLYTTGGWISQPKVSPDGKRVAFIDHPLASGDDQGQPAMVDLNGKVTKFGEVWASVQGLGWSPDGKEIWFSGSNLGSDRSIYAFNVSGKMRSLARVPGDLLVQDVRPNGEILVVRNDITLGLRGVAPGQKQERELSFLDYGIVRDLTPDGKTVLFEEEGTGGGTNYTVYIRGTNGSAPVKLSEGVAQAISPDGKWVMVIKTRTPQQLIMVPTGAGSPEQLSHDNKDYFGVRFLPDGNHILYCAGAPGAPFRCHNMDLRSRKSVAILPENVFMGRVISHDGKSILTTYKGKSYLWPTDGSWADKDPQTATPIQGELGSTYRAIAYTPDGSSVYAASERPEDLLPLKIYIYDLKTGAVKPWKTVGPPDLTGVPGVRLPYFSTDGTAYVYGYNKVLSQLYIVSGIR